MNGGGGSVSSSISTRVTAYHEAEAKDAGVEDDITAFYLAKEELLKLRGGR
jgi:hypothetical protein